MSTDVRRGEGPRKVAMRGGTAQRKMAKVTVAITDFAELFEMNALDRITVIKAGVPATGLASIAKRMGWPKEQLFRLLDMPRATVDRKAQAKQPLSKEHSARALGIARLVGQVEVMVRESGDPTGFDAAKWVADWLDRPQPALGGKPPAEFMDTTEGQALVAALLRQVQSGAYA